MRDASNLISRYLFHPLWDVWDSSIRLRSLKEFERTQWLSLPELQERQWSKLRGILAYAYDNCPWYQHRFGDLDVQPGDFKTLEDFRKLPLLSKRDIQASPELLLSRRYKHEELFSAKTGGSTGLSLRVYFDKRCAEMRNACAARSDRWAGWDLGAKRAAIWGNPPVADTLKKKVRHALYDRTIYLDTMKLDEMTMTAFVNAWRRFRPSALFGHAHSIFMFAQFLLAKGITDLRPKGIISSSMMLIQPERERIEQAFGCKVTDRYGCEEVSLIACECEQHRGMHLNLDHLFIEFLRDDGLPADPGEEGEIVVTDLINLGMPLIRYRIEDTGIPSARKCPCGRGLPLMEKVIGRAADFLVRPDRSLVAGVSLVERTLTRISGIQQMQIVQEDVSDLTLNVVRGVSYNQSSEDELLREFQTVFSDEVRIHIRYVNRLSQERSGKYRFSISKVERPAWAASCR